MNNELDGRSILPNDLDRWRLFIFFFVIFFSLIAFDKNGVVIPIAHLSSSMPSIIVGRANHFPVAFAVSDPGATNKVLQGGKVVYSGSN